MARSSDSPKETVSRRKVLRSTGYGALGAVGLGSMPTVIRAEEGTVRIPIHAQGDKIIRYKDVNARWWDYNLRARSVLEELKNRFASYPGVREFERTTTNEKHKGLDRYKQKIVIGVENSESWSTSSAFPDKIGDIPIEQKQFQEPEDTVVPVRGGMSGGDSNSGGTLTCPVKWDGKTCMMTARHLFAPSIDGQHKRCYTGDVTGDDMWQDNHIIGNVLGAWQNMDIAVATKLTSSDIDFQNRIVNQQGLIRGRMTSGRIDDFVTQKRSLYKNGKISDKRYGVLRSNTHVVPCNNSADNITDALKVDVSQFPGDSGAPIYEEFTNDHLNRIDVYMAGIATQRHDGVAVGAQAPNMHNSHGINFISGSI